jgi:hypothetical protein
VKQQGKERMGEEGRGWKHSPLIILVTDHFLLSNLWKVSFLFEKLVPKTRYQIFFSATGGIQTFAEDEDLNKLMENSMKTLGLSGHTLSGKTIYGPGDIGSNLIY